MEAFVSTQTITPSELLIDALWTPKMTARRLAVSVGTLAAWRIEEKIRLPFIVVGGQIRYEREAVESFLKSQTADGVNAPERRRGGPGRPKGSPKRKKNARRK